MNHHATDHMTRARREKLRWLVLYVLSQFPQVGCNEVSLNYMVGAVEGLERLTRDELRAAMMYLHERELIRLDHGDHIVHWHGKLTRVGFDVVEYVVPCEPGIARPPKVD
jgi:hypothetical protein